ncbi:hypothetical protein N7G274_008165 [Stereocaulon virgatum]|uniref:Uncharacterized protein n=1 Tax=Stereocaulon virgatum TaxID=373712 RepID=A0ABR4A1F3_9LECA
MLASTIALPGTNEPPTLEKRDHFGWVGSFTSSDCHGNPDAKYQWPEIKTWVGDAKTPCVPFSPLPNEWIGINYGSGDYHSQTVQFFENDKCQDSSGVLLWPSGKGLGSRKFNATVESAQIAYA